MTKCKPIPNLGQKHLSLFWGNINFTNDNECWEWLGYKDTCGYGRLCIGGGFFSAHRLAYFIFNKVDPGELSVLHKCDNPACCSKNHLFLGTQKDNVVDMMVKGRHVSHSGEQNAESKLKESEVIEIRNLYAAGTHTYKMLAKKYNVTFHLVSLIIKSKIWKHVLDKNAKVNQTNKRSKLTEYQVKEILSAHKNGETQKSLSHRYGIVNSQISYIVNRKSWKHINI